MLNKIGLNLESKFNLFSNILQVIKQIPPGKVATYGQIAKLAGTQNPRLVGFALAGQKEDTDVPWFRVINSKGKISFSEENDAFKIQYSLLNSEGVKFDNKNRIDLNIYRWSEAND